VQLWTLKAFVGGTQNILLSGAGYATGNMTSFSPPPPNVFSGGATVG